MKLITGFGIAFFSFVAVTGAAVAQDESAGGIKAAAPEGETQYKAKTVYDFEDDTVEGDLQRPDGEFVDANRKAEHASLIEIRKDFIPEMLKSLEDI